MEHKELEEHTEEHGDIEPAVVRKIAPNESLAEEMKKHDIQCEPLQTGSHPLEGKPYYSYLFPLTSRLVTNRGLVRLKGRNIDFVQVLQRN